MSLTNWPKDKNIGDIYTNPLGVKWKWNGKGWVSLKESDVVYLTGPTGPAGQIGINSVTYQFSHSPMDPVDNMLYYIGNIPDSPAQSNNSIASKRVISLVSGQVKKITIMTQIGGDLGSNENQIFILRNFTKNVQLVIDSGYKNLQNSQLDNFIIDVPLDVSIDDELEIIWQVPTFINSPKLVRHAFNVYVEY